VPTRCLELVVEGGAERLRGDVRVGEKAFVDRAALRPGPVAAYVAPAGEAPTAAERLQAASARIARMLESAKSVSVVGDGIVAALLKDALGQRLASSNPAEASVDTTGDPKKIAELLASAPPLATVVLAGGSCNPVDVDLYSTIHLKGLRVAGVAIWASGGPTSGLTTFPAPTPVALGAELPHSGLWLEVERPAGIA
jgi:hypothetical protein